MKIKEVSLMSEFFSMSDVYSSKEVSSKHIVSLMMKGSLKEVLKEDLFSDESFIP